MRYCYDFCEIADLDLIKNIDENTWFMLPNIEKIKDQNIYASFYDREEKIFKIVKESELNNYKNPYTYLLQTGIELKEWINKVYE